VNCSSVGSSPWAAVLHELLQRGFTMESQALPANLLQDGLLSPWVRGSCQEPAAAWAPHGVEASFGHPSAPAWGPPRAVGVDLLLHGCRDSLPHHGLLHGCRERLLRCLEHLLPSFCTGLGACRVVPLTYLRSSLWLLFFSSRVFFSC